MSPALTLCVDQEENHSQHQDFIWAKTAGKAMCAYYGGIRYSSPLQLYIFTKIAPLFT